MVPLSTASTGVPIGQLMSSALQLSQLGNPPVSALWVPWLGRPISVCGGSATGQVTVGIGVRQQPGGEAVGVAHQERVGGGPMSRSLTVGWRRLKAATASTIASS